MRLTSTAGTGSTYVTCKNRRDDPGRPVLRTDDRIVRRHVDPGRSAAVATTSKTVRDRQRRVVVARHAERRAAPQAAVRTAATPEERADARRADRVS